MCQYEKEPFRALFVVYVQCGYGEIVSNHKDEMIIVFFTGENSLLSTNSNLLLRRIYMKKVLSTALALTFLLSITSCAEKEVSSSETVSESSSESQTVTESSETEEDKEETGEAESGEKYKKYASMSAEEIVASLTLEQKVGQMLLPAVYWLEDGMMEKYDFGSVLSTADLLTSDDWCELIDWLQHEATASEAGIPFIYGQDDVHGVNYALNTVLFPHNIGLGAANDEELMYQVGLITADEAKICHMLWNYSPVLAQSADPRWGRTYESFGSDLDTIQTLSTAYTKGLVDGGMIACAKHFFAEGNVGYGTGEKTEHDMLIDRGDSVLTDEEIEAQLKLYQAQIDAGVQTIMISHSSLNGVKMHENKEYIMKLKDEMGFEGFIVSDWNSVQNTSGETYEEQLITSINAGIDMLMEVDTFEDVYDIIIEAVHNGDISEERINDAAERIIRVKLENGIFDDPYMENLDTKQTETGSDEYRAVAEKLVEESLVLLKNDGETLPLKQGASVYITGPAADNAHAQCGGWTLQWLGSPEKDIPGATSVLAGFEKKAEEYGINVIKDKKEAENADVVVLVVGEDAYSEWEGDTENMELCGALGLEGNRKAIEEAESLGKPVVTCIIAGRQVILDEKDFDNWDSVVMCYLPGSEGQGVADVLCGGSSFTGKLPSPWYSSVDQIGTDECWLERGFGLEY